MPQHHHRICNHLCSGFHLISRQNFAPTARTTIDLRLWHGRLSLRPAPSMQITGQSQRAVIHHLDDAQQRESHKQAEQTATVGEKISGAVQLTSIGGKELIVFERNRHAHVLTTILERAIHAVLEATSIVARKRQLRIVRDRFAGRQTVAVVLQAERDAAVAGFAGEAADARQVVTWTERTIKVCGLLGRESFHETYGALKT